MAKKRTKAKSKTKGTSRLSLESIWPQERDLMERPDRYKYVRKIVRPTGCVFCEARDQGLGAESLVLYSDDQVLVMLNKFPYNNGHLLILPRRHCGDLRELKESEYLAVAKMVRQAVEVVYKAYQCAGCNVGLNHGSVAGAGIPEHLHFHVVPRWHGDTNFFPLIAETKVLAETLAQSYERLAPYFKGE